MKQSEFQEIRRAIVQLTVRISDLGHKLTWEEQALHDRAMQLIKKWG